MLINIQARQAYSRPPPPPQQIYRFSGWEMFTFLLILVKFLMVNPNKHILSSASHAVQCVAAGCTPPTHKYIQRRLLSDDQRNEPNYSPLITSLTNCLQLMVLLKLPPLAVPELQDRFCTMFTVVAAAVQRQRYLPPTAPVTIAISIHNPANYCTGSLKYTPVQK